ncbi:MAG TPA: S9 family peptidase [Chitinophagaceae bacterium]
MRKLFLLFLIIPLISTAQKKLITLEDIYKKGTFRGEIVRGFTEPEDSLFNPADVVDESGKQINTADYSISADKKRIIFFTGREPIYRRSTKSNAHVYDVATRKTIPLHKGKIMHPNFSPDGTKIAFVFENNLYLYDLLTNNTKAITTDGKWNYIINGNADWVYEEEFSFSQAYQWSPAGNYIAYYKFDESKVKEFNMTIYDDKYNKDYRFKYPKAGDSNSTVTIHIYNVNNGNTALAEYEQGDIYIPRIKWTQSDDKLVVYWMNRLQNNLKLLLTDAITGKATKMYDETNKYYVDITDDWWFLKDGKHFLFGSEMNGYYKLYLYSIDGKRKTEITRSNFDVADVNAVDEKNRLVYYTLAYPTPMDRNLFVSDFDGKKTWQLTKGNGWHRVTLNNNFTQFYDYYSNINTPQSVILYDIKKTRSAVTAVQNKVVNEGNKLKNLLNEYAISKAEFLRVPNSKGDTLNGWMIKPMNFDPSKKYPVLFCNYGGPGSQQVANRFGAVSFWHQMLAQKGFIVVSVDNTGTGYRGEEFKKKTYLRLGQLEIEDQVDAAKWLISLGYVDKNNIGHWGWSYGGFMSSLAVTKGADVFTAGIAVAPVTSWRYYDNIYTERFMRTPQENKLGYDTTAPINYVDKIRGKYLLIHGSADDNVHFQNSVQMVSALVKANVDFETMYYPNKNHGISGGADNTTYHLWTKMTNWILENLGNQNVNKAPVGTSINGPQKTF